jgi:hypothetical protein
MIDLSAIVSQGDVDSGALTGLSVVAHRFGKAEQVTIRVLKKGKLSHAMRLNIAGKAEKGGKEQHVDITKPRRAKASDQATETQAARQGYVLFQAPGEAPHAFVVHAASGNEAGAIDTKIPSEPPLFDSRQLGSGDIFSTVMFRPGKYLLKNELSNSVGTVTVSYPEIKPRQQYEAPDPVRIKCGPKGFEPHDIKLKPAQGLVFRIGTQARITIALESPDDGPPASANKGD